MNDIHAFPRPHSGKTNFSQEGMTLRDYFAIKIMQNLTSGHGHFVGDSMWESSAKCSYKVADIMLEARKK